MPPFTSPTVISPPSRPAISCIKAPTCSEVLREPRPQIWALKNALAGQLFPLLLQKLLLAGPLEAKKEAKRVLGMHADGLPYRLIARNVGLSKNTVMDIVRRNNGERGA